MTTETVRVWSPSAFNSMRDDHRPLAIKVGWNDIPSELAGHDYLKAHGACRLEDMTPAQRLVFDRAQEDEALAAKRRKQDVDIFNRRALQDIELARKQRGFAT